MDVCRRPYVFARVTGGRELVLTDAQADPICQSPPGWEGGDEEHREVNTVLQL